MLPKKPVRVKKRTFESRSKKRNKGFGTLKGVGSFTAEDELKVQD
ncbi:MAG: hypothetical protein NWE95_12955 [Candidatus Bathyarchaeota archaeon]|nr:hypothetical protein [Candidatus Bathyarchaeota archaeon]